MKAKPLSSVVAAALALLIAAPGWSFVSALRGEANLAAPRLPEVPGWHRSYSPMAYPWRPHFTGADYRLQARYADDAGHIVDLALIIYARQSEGRELVGFGEGAAGPGSGWSWSSPAWSPPGALGEQITAPGPVPRQVVSFYRIGSGAPTGNRFSVKLDTMKARLFGQDQRAVAILVSAEESGTQSAENAIRAFLTSLGNPEELADAVAQNR